MTTLITQELRTLITLRQQLQDTFENLETLQYDNNLDLGLHNTLHTLQNEIDRIDYIPVLSISFDTGFVFQKVVHFLGDSNSDIMALIDAYATEDNCQLCFYEATEVLSYDDEYINENFLSINGGACYTDMVMTSNENILYSILALLNKNL